MFNCTIVQITKFKGPFRIRGVGSIKRLGGGGGFEGHFWMKRAPENFSGNVGDGVGGGLQMIQNAI